MAPLPRLAFLGVLLAAHPVAADELATAKQLFKQAETRYQAADYRAALELYQQAFAAKPLPGFHFNIAQCHRNLGEHEKAIEHFRLYLDSSRSPKHAAEARRLIGLCEAEVAKTPRATPDPMPTTAQAPIEPPPSPPPTNKRRRLRPAFFWAGLAVSAAFLGTGTVTGAMALSKSSRFKNLSTPASELKGLRDSGETLRTISTITFAVGAATSVATGVLFFFTDFRPAAERRLSAAPIPGGGLVSLEGAF